MARQANSPVVKSLLDRTVRQLREEDEVIGNLTDIKAKWLVAFTQWLFYGNDRAMFKEVVMGVDFDDMTIYLSPCKDIGKDYSTKEWSKKKKDLDLKTHELRLPGYLEIPKFKIRFVRDLPKKEMVDVNRVGDNSEQS